VSAPWAPPPRPERRHGRADEVSAEDRRRLAAVLDRLHWLEAELDGMEAQQRRQRRQFWLAVAVGLVAALVLL
jgi:hypothetical protein